MFFGLLGPVAAWRDGREVDLGTPQQRALFALLLLHRNEVVSTDRMLDAIWPVRPPRSAMQVLRTYVLRLCGGLRDGEIASVGAPVLVTHRHGYQLTLGSDQVDADRFESLVNAGRAEREGGRFDASAALLREALGLVRGVPLAELGDDDHARHERERLEELRLVAEEELVEAQLGQGRHRELIPQLRSAVSAQPLRERSWGQLMVALYRSGRQAEALAAYRAASRLFLDELGLAPSGELRALERMILVHDESLQPPSARGHQQPSYGTSFVGRDAELEAIAADLRHGRIVTLVGPAGAGKTRLAAEVAADLSRALSLALWWVDLGSVAVGQVNASVSRQLAVRELPGQSPVDLVVRRLRDAPGLLVLDNCEHVLEEVAELVARIVAHAPRVRILSTSREALRIGGEAIRPVTGLHVPPESADGVAVVMEHAAGRLYVERARAATDDFRLDEPAAAAVCEVVRRVDGLPLAIELAAGRLRSLTTAELARGLRERIWLLEEGDRAAPKRHRTLEAAIGWSYELVSRQERIVLRRLSVFPGSFDAAAGEEVAAGDELDPACVLPALTRLVEASLLVAEPRGETTRYRLLQTVRAFARERALRAGEHEAAARRHRDAYAALVEQVHANMTGAGLATWLPHARQEHENFDVALRWSLDRRDGEPALQLASGLFLFWFRTGFVTQGRELLDHALRIADPGSRWRSRGLVGRAWLAYAAESPDLLAIARESVAACERHGDPDLLAAAVRVEAYALMATGALPDARAAVERARELAASSGDDEGLAIAEQQLGNLLSRAGDLDGAAERLLRARDGMRRLRGTLDAGWVLVELARVMLARRRPDEAIEPATDAVADFRRRGDPRGVAGGFLCLGQAHAALGDRRIARAMLDEALEISDRWGYPAQTREARRALAELSAPTAPE
jgi:predicted ATPase/DNA-binding SARP family transcriptional activator